VGLQGWGIQFGLVKGGVVAKKTTIPMKRPMPEKGLLKGPEPFFKERRWERETRIRVVPARDGGWRRTGASVHLLGLDMRTVEGRGTLLSAKVQSEKTCAQKKIARNAKPWGTQGNRHLSKGSQFLREGRTVVGCRKRSNKRKSNEKEEKTPWNRKYSRD